jgi:hypothetical protein
MAFSTDATPGISRSQLFASADSSAEQTICLRSAYGQTIRGRHFLLQIILIFVHSTFSSENGSYAKEVYSDKKRGQIS